MTIDTPVQDSTVDILVDPARAARRWPTRLLLAVAIAWLLFTVLQLILRDWPLWTLMDLLPPILFLLVPLASLLLATPFPKVRLRMTVRARAITAAAAAAALALGAGQAGVNWSAVFGGGDGPAPPGAIKVVSWDTLYWDQTDDPDRFYAFLKGQHADVYVLQEYVAGEPNALVPIEDTGRLRDAFPGYHIATAGELITLSRFPITGQNPLPTSATAPAGTTYTAWPDFWRYRVLRTDLDLGGRTMSLYNLHIPDVVDLDLNPLTGRFYGTVNALSANRQLQFRALRDDLARNANPAVITGVTNTLPDMGDRRWFDGLSDAARAGGPLYPTTLSFHGLPLWRMDWTYTTAGVRVHSYDLAAPQGMSTHRLQSFVVSVTGQR